MRSCRRTTTLLSAAIVAALGLMQSARASVVLYVDDDAPSGRPGTTWQTAYKYLADALAFASDPKNAVTEIRVAQGVYRPDRSAANPAGTHDRQSRFLLVSGVALRGGYAGLTAGRKGDRDTRDIALYPSVLSGDLASDDAPGFVNSVENAYQVVVALNVDSTAVLDGFTITAGRADGPGLGAVPESLDQGSGLNIYFSSPTIVNCTFYRNWSLNHGAVNDHGDESTVTNCVFRENHSVLLGAGLYIHHESMTTASGCQFIDNVTEGHGAGAYSRSMHKGMLVDCSFSGNQAQLGGGMYSADTSMTMVMNCTFTGNSASSGGGMYVEEGAPNVMGCTFTDNLADDGAGIFTTHTTGLIDGCTFIGNNASFGLGKGGAGGGGGSGGGGVWNTGGTPTVSNCTFTGNLASFGAGVYNIDESIPIVIGCTFTANHASEGAGVYNLLSNALVTNCIFNNNIVDGGPFPVGGGVSNYFCNAVISACSFTGNRAELGGGGIYNEGEEPTVTNCTFTGNFTTGSRQGWGGGLHNSYQTLATISGCTFNGNTANRGGGMYNSIYSRPIITDCVIRGNNAPEGGGVYSRSSDDGFVPTMPSLANCLIAGNSAARGGGMYADGGSPRIINCTIAGNTASQSGGALYTGTSGSPIVANSVIWSNGSAPTFDASGAALVTFSCVQFGHAGQGNISADPHFTSASDFRLASHSPCIDAAANAAVPAGITTDLAGAPRFHNDPATPDTGAGTAPIVDMGAYEYPGPAADLNGDGIVNSLDLGILLSGWSIPAGAPGCGGSLPCPADLNHDGFVNTLDLGILLSAWTL